jgi:hypothetical protein
MRRILNFLILALVKFSSWIFFRAHYYFLSSKRIPWKNIKLMVFLNHTSLYEPLFIQILPLSYLWHLSGHFTVPVADITIKRPIVGFIFKLMIPNMVVTNRKNDGSWSQFISSNKHKDVVLILPEGRMKRPNGLDKYGKPMSVRGGVADLILSIDDGEMLIALSGGLHHVQAPGQMFPKLFKNIFMNLDFINLKDYKNSFPGNSREKKLAIVEDLQKRLENDCPNMNKWNSSHPAPLDESEKARDARAQ